MITKKYLIIGGIAAGASTSARLRRLDESAMIIMFEKGQRVSFSNCGLPYHLGGYIEPSEKLILMTPEKFYKQYKIDTHTNSEVIAIYRVNKLVTVLNHQNGEKI